ncbi:glycosyltransferase family 9 protein [Allomuricauda sp. SCSIO 65647]|uniref:glycosyltransferase family 9 protein n=1 Tax=Allomuricauda sp. SCSIO 65647 TaxID=2908843 RepID=UPI001F40E9BF|nr:glycosyltransferase family 9 protein [Muricauda sp. SCSIO 65647]UJH69032.1 glycosyltransferase family 9 protein [Muricauda sp. SCSIO 65647]
MARRAEYDHLLILRFSALGDVAMAVPVLLAAIKKYPRLKITVVSRDFHQPLFERIERVDFHKAMLSGKHKGVLGLWKLYNELKKRNIDAVADLHNVLRSKVLKFFFSIGGFKLAQIDKGRADKRALTRKKDKIFKPLKTTHQRYADVFAQLGYPIELQGDDVLRPLKMSENINGLTREKAEQWLGIAPFAAHSGKMYPFERMKGVVESLKNTKKYKIFLFGGGDKEKQQLQTLASSAENVINIAGRLSFKEELQLISNLDLMVSMDSANGHLAANYGVPVISLWGVTHPYAGFYPFGQPFSNALLSDRIKYPAIPTSIYGNKVPKGYENAIQTISEETILHKIKEVLG